MMQHLRLEYCIVGLENEETGFVDQVNTGDIAWSIFVVRFGIIGTIIFLVYYFGLMRFFDKRSNDNIAKSAFSTMIGIFITSLTGTVILKLEFIAIFLFAYILIEKTKINKEKNLQIE